MTRVALVALFVTLALASVAEAHANYVKSTPAADARLVKPPSEIRVTFSEPPAVPGSELAVLDVSGKRVDRADTALTGVENEARVTLPAVGDGGYTVAWTALSAVDGHQTKGTFVFAVGDAPLPAIKDVPNAYPAPTPLEVAGRAASYAGIALALGVAFFGVVIRPPADEPERRREAQLLLAAAALLVVGSLALIVTGGSTLPQRLGALLDLRAFAGLVTVAMLRVPDHVLPRSVRHVVIVFAGASAALTATLVSHAAALGSLKDTLLDLAHVSAVSVWVGGIAALLWVVLPSTRALEAEGARRLGRSVWRFSLTALVAVAVIITSGTLQSLDRLVLLQDLWETPYGIALAAKIVLLASTLAFGAMNLLLWGPRLSRGLVAPRTMLLRGTLAETAILSLILVAAGFLTAFAPPAQPSAAAYDETHHASDLRLELLVSSSLPGRNRYVLRVHEGLAPVREAEKVAFRFTMIEHDMGEQEIVAAERAPGEYVADGSPTSMFGTWRLEAIVRLRGREDVRSLFTFPVFSPTTGTGTSARAIRAGPYTMIVFTDPVSPQAGAPLTVNVVLIDAKGDPVPGKQVRASFAGPAGASPAPALLATESPAQTGPGRYVLQVAALDAGSWQVTILVGSEASGVYPIEVSR